MKRVAKNKYRLSINDLLLFTLRLILSKMIQIYSNSNFLAKHTKIYQKADTKSSCDPSNIIFLPKAKIQNSFYKKVLNLKLLRNSSCL